MDRDRRDELEICHGFNREKGVLSCHPSDMLLLHDTSCSTVARCCAGSAKEETGSENPNESTESVGAGAPSDGPPETGSLLICTEVCSRAHLARSDCIYASTDGESSMSD